MSKIKDTMIEEHDFEMEDTEELDIMDVLHELSLKLSGLEYKLDKIHENVTYQKNVNKNGMPKKKSGRKKADLYYKDKLVSDEYLRHIYNFLHIGITEIAKESYYIDHLGNKITDINKVRNLIYGRVRG